MERAEGTALQAWGGRRRAMGFSALVAILLGGTTLLLPLLPFPVESAATIAMGAALLAFGILRARDGRLDWFELLLPVGIMYVLYFGVGALHMKANPGRVGGASLNNYVSPALGVAFAGFVAMILGYATMFRRTRLSPSLEVEPTGTGMVVLGGIGVGGVIASVAQGNLVASGARFSAVFSLLDQLSPLFMVAWAAGWYMLWAKRLDARGKFALFGVLLPASLAVIALTVGGKQRVILILLIPLMARWYARRRMPWAAILALLLLVIFVVFPLYNSFRTTNRELAQATRVDRAFTSATRWNADEYMEHSTTAFLDRIAIVSSVAAILRDVPDTVGYKYGATLALAPIGLLIPRLLWPDKPNISIGREFAETFQLIGSFDRETSIAPSIVGDFYWNFALPGVIVGMFLFGAAMRWYYQRFGAGTSYDPMRKAFYLALFTIITHFEGNVAGVFSVMVKTTFIILVLTYVFRRFGLVRDVPPGI